MSRLEALNNHIDIENLENYNDEFFTRKFYEFEKGIIELERMDKRLRLKKVIDKKAPMPDMIIFCIECLEEIEKRYYSYFLKLLNTTNIYDKEYYKRQLVEIIFNKYGIMNKMDEWEWELRGM